MLIAGSEVSRALVAVFGRVLGNYAGPVEHDVDMRSWWC